MGTEQTYADVLEVITLKLSFYDRYDLVQCYGVLFQALPLDCLNGCALSHLDSHKADGEISIFIFSPEVMVLHTIQNHLINSPVFMQSQVDQTTEMVMMPENMEKDGWVLENQLYSAFGNLQAPIVLGHKLVRKAIKPKNKTIPTAFPPQYGYPPSQPYYMRHMVPFSGLSEMAKGYLLVLCAFYVIKWLYDYSGEISWQMPFGTLIIIITGLPMWFVILSVLLMFSGRKAGFHILVSSRIFFRAPILLVYSSYEINGAVAVVVGEVIFFLVTYGFLKEDLPNMR